ncbi:MAG: hypothetical protein ABJA32_06535 [Ginsengibacter sp.]
MKHAFLLGTFLSFWMINFAQTFSSDKLDLPGDNLNLYAVLKIFQESETLESFEKTLNDENNHINNLDLNGDEKTDYIRVIDKPDGDLHNITLRVSVNQNQEQDVAVIMVQKNKDGNPEVQIIGDEDLYGKDYIVEPNYGDDNIAGTPNPGYIPPAATELNKEIVVQSTTPAQVASWQIIRYIYVPTYVAWRSPWRWSFYPSYWRPWRPSYWHQYYGYHYHLDYFYFGHYRRWQYYRYPSWRTYYYRPGFRTQSVFVQTRYKRGDYRTTYSRPDLAKRGSEQFRKDFPTAPSRNDKLPPFDKTGRPVHPKTVTRPVLKPVVTHPVTRPAPNPITKPVKRPVTQPGITKPATRPAPKPIIRPVTRPVTRPDLTKPVTRPVTKPVTRPIANPAPFPTDRRGL